MPEPKDLASIQDSARLTGFLPYLDNELRRMEEVLDTKIFILLDKGELTPEAAKDAWIEKRAIRRLGRRFDQRVKLGVSTGARLHEALENGYTAPISIDNPEGTV